MYSGLAEAYGVYTTLCFLQHYCQHYPKLQQQHHNVHVYCDNQGVIDRTNRDPICSYPRDAISDDYPIFAEISQTMSELRPLNIRMQHVKGHQDTKSDCPLTLPEKLNIDCDARASKMDTTKNYDTQLNNPMLQVAYPHLQINEQIITRKIQHNLHAAAQTKDYYEYLRNKFSWTQDPAQTIHWPTFQLVLTRFRQTK